MNYPKGETIWVSYYNNKGDLIFVITSKTTRDYYYLYEVVNNELKKLGRSKTPTELEEKYNIHDKCKI